MRVGSSSAGQSFFSDETRLLLYALDRQATHGALATAKTEVMQADEISVGGDERLLRAMRNAWSGLGTMPSAEAMRLYVKILDEEKPNWWDPKAMERDAKRTNKGMLKKSGLCALPDGIAEECERGGGETWTFMEYGGKRAPPRFQHAACVVGDKMYVIGGSHRGRFLSDAHELDLSTSTWRLLKPRPGSTPLPPCAGHRLASCMGQVYVVGGRFKGSDSHVMEVYRMKMANGDVDEIEWVRVETRGDEAPCARRGASVTVLNDGLKLVVFGGESSDRRFLNDAWILDMTSYTWKRIECADKQSLPEARADHTSTLWGPETLVVFGGTSETKVFDDVYALDLVHYKWSAITPRGKPPPPRAGHCGVLLGDGRYWALVGGGNNARGLTECSVLDLDDMSWVARRDAFVAPPVVGEGMTLCALGTRDGYEAIIAFGGYNGQTQNETQVLLVPEDFPNHETAKNGSASRTPKNGATAKPTESDAASVGSETDTGSTSSFMDFIKSTKSTKSTTTTTTTPGTPKQEPPTPAPTPTSTDDIRRENAELRRSLHRLRSDAKIVADAHDKLVETCNALERELDVERERSSELEEKVRALADQLKSVGGHSGSFFSP